MGKSNSDGQSVEENRRFELERWKEEIRQMSDQEWGELVSGGGQVEKISMDKSSGWSVKGYDSKIEAAVSLFWLIEFRPPTLRELSDVTGNPSTNTVKNALARLTAAGRMHMSKNKPVPPWVVDAIKSSRSWYTPRESGGQ